MSNVLMLLKIVEIKNLKLQLFSLETILIPSKSLNNIKEYYFWQEISYEENENLGKNLYLKIYYLSISRL